VPVLVTRYGLDVEIAAGLGIAAGFGGADGFLEEAVVEALAMPRKCLSVEGRGRPIGRRKERDI